MKFRNLVILIAVFLIVSTVIWVIAERNQSIRPMQPLTRTPPMPLAEPQATPVATVSVPQTPPTPLAGSDPMAASTISATQLASSMPDVMPRGPYQGMNDQRWPIYWKKREQDRAFEWKTPIEFYGKVVDQNEQPIPDAEVRMNWTDMSPKGTSDAIRTTDGDGRFSITGVQGKNFGVRSIKKDGYIEAFRSNPHSFEYAGFWEPSYHEPDPTNPVIFHMRKKGEAAALVSSEGKLY